MGGGQEFRAERTHLDLQVEILSGEVKYVSLQRGERAGLEEVTWVFDIKMAFKTDSEAPKR